MTEFNEIKSSNEYLTSQLILARKTNDLMSENAELLEELKELKAMITFLSKAYDENI